MHKKEIIIILDAMGGDHAPDEIIKGAGLALEENKNLKIILVGKKKLLNEKLFEFKIKRDLIEIVNADEIITNSDQPAKAMKNKKDSSLIRALELLKEKRADGFVSAGNTGAVLLCSSVILKRIANITRPALATHLPNLKSFSVLIDSGANVDCKANMIEQFAKMGYIYMKNVMKINEPKVALLNIGLEAEKGNMLAKESYKILSELNINFVGNIEARDVPFGIADVIVCDGFVGNVIIKHTEGLAQGIFNLLKHEIKKNIWCKLGGMMLKSGLVNIKKRFDYSEVGGVQLLGLESVVIKAHGSSDSRAIKNAIKKCVLFIESDVARKIQEVCE